MLLPDADLPPKLLDQSSERIFRPRTVTLSLSAIPLRILYKDEGQGEISTFTASMLIDKAICRRRSLVRGQMRNLMTTNRLAEMNIER